MNDVLFCMVRNFKDNKKSTSATIRGISLFPEAFLDFILCFVFLVASGNNS